MDVIMKQTVMIDVNDHQLPATVKCLWFYEIEPIATLTFITILDPTNQNVIWLYQSIDPIDSVCLHSFMTSTYHLDLLSHPNGSLEMSLSTEFVYGNSTLTIMQMWSLKGG